MSREQSSRRYSCSRRRAFSPSTFTDCFLALSEGQQISPCQIQAVFEHVTLCVQPKKKKTHPEIRPKCFFAITPHLRPETQTLIVYNSSLYHSSEAADSVWSVCEDALFVSQTRSCVEGIVGTVFGRHRSSWVNQRGWRM